MITKNSKELTLIVYDSPSPPKCVKINKNVFKLILTIVPLIVIISLSVTLFITSNLKQLDLKTKKKQPKLINKLKATILALETKVDQKEILNKELAFKVSQGATNIGIGANLFKIPLGYTDKTEQTLTKTSNVKFEIKKNQAEIRFDLINNRESGTKLSGYIFVVQISGSSIQFYPDNPLSTKDYFLKYNSGEVFTASRFRPVIAKFKIHDKDESLHYKTFIFSSTGDLILEKVMGPYHATE
jgi:predicted Holliday junction resolvase-like endonuclease